MTAGLEPSDALKIIALIGRAIRAERRVAVLDRTTKHEWGVHGFHVDSDGTPVLEFSSSPNLYRDEVLEQFGEMPTDAETS